jgi:aspartyl/asparaginyl-tRNA synthetase
MKTNRNFNHPFYPQIEGKKFTKVTGLLREFFLSKGFLEVHPQNRLSILAACENPHSIATFEYEGEVWPLPQTNQMSLEDYLLFNPEEKGFFCLSTSYRNEKTPEINRHAKIFPMFEFELHGGFDTLLQMEKELLSHLGFTEEFVEMDYLDAAKEFDCIEIDSKTEGEIAKKYSNTFFLKFFPEHTSPFWNMVRNEKGTANKIDVLLHGIETIGSAERSCDIAKMKETFYSIEEGKYAEKLFELFSKERVEAELEDFFQHNFFQRSGGGIGLTRLVRAMELSNLI